MPDLHSRIASELSRRLEVAKAAAPAWGDVGVVVEAGPDGVAYTAADTTVAHVRLHDPADAERRYSSALRVLERHAIIHRNIGWLEPDDGEMVECSAELPVCGTCVPKHSHFKTRADVPEGACIEVRDLAASLGLDTEGSTTDG